MSWNQINNINSKNQMIQGQRSQIIKYNNQKALTQSMQKCTQFRQPLSPRYTIFAKGMGS